MIGLMWYLMGMMTTGAAWGYVHLSKRYQMNWITHLALAAAFGILWICIGWSWASFAEGEPQSGAMGLVCFGLPGIILLNLTWKRLILPKKIKGQTTDRRQSAKTSFSEKPQSETPASAA